MKKIIFLLLISYGAFQWYTASYGEHSGEQTKTPNKLIMYSLTTCGYCKQKVKQLNKENIKFTEYFIDTDKDKMDELNSKLINAGFKPQRYGTPIFDVHGVMLPNNPDMSLIKARLNKEHL
ncbi:hypothetical protein MNBD_GAMMA09-3445 [hydrothermal vent metagenome]|uniref:Glutaredoxin domain-containing protein n=1 Tax=hydrothermal vent metagenome TaxID=652676 RepID=A0A3B0XD20_9ZZZZ